MTPSSQGRVGGTHRMANHAASKFLKANHQKASQWRNHGNIQQENLLHVNDRHHQSLVLLASSSLPSSSYYQTPPINHRAFFSHPPHPSLFLGAMSSWMSERYSDLKHSPIKWNSWYALQNNKQPVLSSTSVNRVSVSYTITIMASMLSLHRWE